MERKIKLCIISHFGYPLYNHKCKETFGGGAAVQLFMLSKEFAKKRNIDVNVITGNYPSKKGRMELYRNIKLYNILPIKKSMINYIKGLINFFLYLIIIRPDVIIQRLADITTGFCAFFSILFKKRFIFSIGVKTDVNGVSEKGIRGKIYGFGRNHANFIIAQSKDQINELERTQKRKINNIIAIKSGYNINKNSENKKSYILWVGRAVYWKRPELFFKLAKLFPNQEFKMVCYPEYDMNLWRKIHKDAKEITNLEFFKFIPFQKIDEIFQNAKVYINTSIYEGFPNSFIQSFKNKTPVISLNLNPDDLLTKNKIGFFCNDNFDKLVKKLKLLLEKPELFQMYSKNALIYAKKNHDIEKITSNWIKIINYII